MACEIMVQSLPTALANDISASNYFILFKNIVKSNLSSSANEKQPYSYYSMIDQQLKQEKAQKFEMIEEE